MTPELIASREVNGRTYIHLRRPHYTGEEPCASIPTDLYFPETAASVHPVVRQACEECPLLEQCRWWAIAHEGDGFQGGMSATARRHARGRLGWWLTRPEELDRFVYPPVRRGAA